MSKSKGRVEAHRQAREHSKQRAPPVELARWRVQLEAGEAPHQRADRDLRLHAREVRAEAEVGAVAEAQVRDLLARHVEPIGILEWS